ncbi:tail fiber [Sinorhizobium phage StopSmel]|nr:tail fiber [Sinorhizobium phage StopSmel]
MALSSFYSVGTATVAANSTTVTGQGTSWLNTVQPGDLFGTHKGVGVRILAVNSNTSLTLAYPWPAAAQATAAYEIQITPDVTRMDKTTRDIIEMLQNGNLDAIAALVSAADKLPYFTGAGAAALTDIKAKGRDVLAADTMLSLLGKLGPVNGGGASPVPSNADVGLLDGNFDAIRAPGTYNITGDWLNGFSGAAASAYAGWLHVYSRGTHVYQEFVQASNATPVRWTRFTASATSWPNPWRDITPLAYASTMEIANVNLPGRLRSIPAIVLGDVHSITESGFYSCNSGTANIPEGAQGSIIAMMINSTTGWVIWTRTSNGSSYMKWMNAGAWSAWAKIAQQDRGNTWTGSQTVDSGGGYVNFSVVRGAMIGQFEAAPSWLSIGTNSDHTVTFKANNTERMRLPNDANGDLLIGLTAEFNLASGTTTGLQVRGNTGRMIRRVNGFQPFYQARLGSDGGIMSFYREYSEVGSVSVTTTGAAYNTTSDYRLKNDIQPIVEFSLTPEQFAVLDNAELKIMALRPVFHRWNSAPEKGVVTGFIAHEVQQVIPHAVTGIKDGMVDIGRETIPAKEVDQESVDEDGNTEIVTVIVPEVINEDVRRDALSEGSAFEKTGELAVFQTMDYGLITADIVAALQCVIHKNMLQGEQIETLTSQMSALVARIEALEALASSTPPAQ